jgi:thioredoxin reductase/NAD-dependent dihydropyrimidine dehydrogenase PreA subunit
MASDALIVWGAGVALFLAAALPYYLRQRRLEARTRQSELEALRYGLKEPVTLHPVVDPERCIGTGNCIAVCPEGDVLGIRAGQAYTVSAARCIGHGLCERACPMEAIRLVIGSERRGVQIPRIKANFETNVPGLYIVGELGGMGLIGNAFEQGRQCIAGIVKEKRPAPGDALDVVIVGCGPAGLSASLNCLHHGLRFVTLEKEDIGGTVRHYPRKKLVLTRPVKVPGYGKLGAREIRKEDLVGLWDEVVEKTGLRVNTRETALAVRRENGAFTVTTSAGTHRATRVVLAIGRRGVPRKLGVPGEDTPKVAYALREPEAYRGDRILVVGGGDSAVEAALALAEQPGNHVALSYRQDRLSRVKPANLERFEAAARRGALEVHWRSEPAEIQPDRVRLRNGGAGELVLPNDYVFVFIGGELPTQFLEACGVAIDTKFGESVRQ